MPTAKLRITGNIGGVPFDGELERTGDALLAHDVALPAGTAGTLTTRVGDASGIMTLEAGHGLQTGDTAAMFWSGGSRYDDSVVVDGDAITIDSTTGGDNLPGLYTAVVVTKAVEITSVFEGDDLQMIAAKCDQRMRLDFVVAVPTVRLDLPAGENWEWAADRGITNPLAGDSITELWAYNASSSASATLLARILYDSTP